MFKNSIQGRERFIVYYFQIVFQLTSVCSDNYFIGKRDNYARRNISQHYKPYPSNPEANIKFSSLQQTGTSHLCISFRQGLFPA